MIGDELRDPIPPGHGERATPINEPDPSGDRLPWRGVPAPGHCERCGYAHPADEPCPERR